MPRKGFRYPNRPRRDQRREWSYLKHRRNPTGVMGRPASTVPLKDRRRAIRRRYRARQTERGVRTMRITLSTASAADLCARAAAEGMAPGALVERLLAAAPVAIPAFQPCPLRTDPPCFGAG